MPDLTSPENIALLQMALHEAQELVAAQKAAYGKLEAIYNAFYAESKDEALMQAQLTQLGKSLDETSAGLKDLQSKCEELTGVIGEVLQRVEQN